MGRPRIKVIDTAIDIEKAEKLEHKESEITKEIGKKAEVEVKAAKKAVPERVKKPKIRSQRYRSLVSQIEKTKEYHLPEAIDIIKKTSNTNFEGSLEAHINLNTDPEKQEQAIRRSINLPYGSGKTLRVLVFGGNSKELKNLGASVGSEATLEKINSGEVEADKIVATPDWMPKITRVAKILGPKGLMPNPKFGTVTAEPEEMVKNLQGGMVEVRTEKAPIIHAVVGKVSFPKDKLEQNVKALISELQKSKPETLKKPLIKSVFLSSTMGPSVKLDLSTL